MSKKKTKTTSSETVAPSSYSQPYIDKAVAGLEPARAQSQGLVDRYLPQASQGIDYFGGVMRGDYLDGNPYLDKVLQRTNSDIRDSVGGAFSSAGRYGSGANAGVMADRIADNENRLRYQDYATERGYQMQAPGMQQGLIESTVGLPMIPANSYANGINGLLGKYMTSNGNSTSKSSGGLLGTIGQVAQIAGTAAMLSDRRTKKDIELIGREPDGLGVYDYRYNWEGDDTPIRRGVMADEVAELRPWALGPQWNGFSTVNYEAL